MIVVCNNKRHLHDIGKHELLDGMDVMFLDDLEHGMLNDELGKQNE